jgi:hypothetical protein
MGGNYLGEVVSALGETVEEKKYVYVHKYIKFSKAYCCSNRACLTSVDVALNLRERLRGEMFRNCFPLDSVAAHSSSLPTRHS